MGKLNSFTERFGDSPLAFGVRRLADQDDRALWRFSVSRYCTSEYIFDTDAEISSLLKMRNFIDRAIEAIKTDGGRT